MKHALSVLALSVFAAGLSAQSQAPAPVAASTTDLSLRGSVYRSDPARWGAVIDAFHTH